MTRSQSPTRDQLTQLIPAILSTLKSAAGIRSYREGLELYLRSPYPLTREGLKAYQRWLKIYGLSAASISLRMLQVRRLALQATLAGVLPVDDYARLIAKERRDPQARVIEPPRDSPLRIRLPHPVIEEARRK